MLTHRLLDFVSEVVPLAEPPSKRMGSLSFPLNQTLKHLFTPQSENLEKCLQGLIQANAKVSGVKGSGFCYKSVVYRDAFAIFNYYNTPLHPSLQRQMDNYLSTFKESKKSIVLTKNYLASVFVTGKSHADRLALLPSEFHFIYSTVMEAVDPSFTAKCWKPTPNLTPEQVEQFKLRNAASLREIKIAHLNRLTL